MLERKLYTVHATHALHHPQQVIASVLRDAQPLGAIRVRVRLVEIKVRVERFEDAIYGLEVVRGQESAMAMKSGSSSRSYLSRW